MLPRCARWCQKSRQSKRAARPCSLTMRLECSRHVRAAAEAQQGCTHITD